MKINEIKYLDFIQARCVDSFSRIKMGRGNGEARLYVGSANNSWNDFFEDFTIRCLFTKDDLITYLEMAKFEYEEQTQQYLEDIQPLWKINMDKVKLLQDYNYFKTEYASGKADKARYYIRLSAPICTLFREMVLPRMTVLLIQKIEYNGERFLWFRPYLPELGNIYEHKVIEQFEENIKADSELLETTKEMLIKARVGQGYFRDELIKKYSGQCIITKIDDTRILVASHIKPWAAANNIERLSNSNGLLLSPTFDKLFDKGFISFKNNGSIILSHHLSDRNFKVLNLESNVKYPIKSNDEMKLFLEYHRDVILLK